MTFDPIELVKNNCYLYGEKPKYNFQTPRQNNYLNNSNTLPWFTQKKTVLTHDLEFIVQGPYDLEKDRARIEKIHYCLDVLHKIGFLKKDGIYESAYLVLESVDIQDKIWIMYEYGGHKDSLRPLSFVHNFSKRDTVQVVICLILKQIMNIIPDLNSILYGKSADKLAMFGLDTIGTSDGKLELSSELRKAIQKYSSNCTEYLDLYKERIYKTLGPNSEEAKLFNLYYAKYIDELTLEPSSNPEFFGWPLETNQRVMFHYNNKLLPGTYIDTTSNQHVPLDPTCFAYTFRKIRPDESYRPQLYDILKVEGQYVRLMTKEEEDMYINKLEEPNFHRSDSYIAYFPGDLVKIYNQEVNNEHDNLGSIKKIRDKNLLSQNPMDVGLVIGHVKDNPYWKMVYLWKQKQIESVSCRYMYWISDVHGRALHVPKASEKLEEIVPRKIMELYLNQFDHLLS
jgi:hypothetical protein